MITLSEATQADFERIIGASEVTKKFGDEVYVKGCRALVNGVLHNDPFARKHYSAKLQAAIKAQFILE